MATELLNHARFSFVAPQLFSATQPITKKTEWLDLRTISSIEVNETLSDNKLDLAIPWLKTPDKLQFTQQDMTELAPLVSALKTVNLFQAQLTLQNKLGEDSVKAIAGCQDADALTRLFFDEEKLADDKLTSGQPLTRLYNTVSDLIKLLMELFNEEGNLRIVFLKFRSTFLQLKRQINEMEQAQIIKEGDSLARQMRLAPMAALLTVTTAVGVSLYLSCRASANSKKANEFQDKTDLMKQVGDTTKCNYMTTPPKNKNPGPLKNIQDSLLKPTSASLTPKTPPAPIAEPSLEPLPAPTVAPIVKPTPAPETLPTPEPANEVINAGQPKRLINATGGSANCEGTGTVQIDGNFDLKGFRDLLIVRGKAIEEMKASGFALKRQGKNSGTKKSGTTDATENRPGTSSHDHNEALSVPGNSRRRPLAETSDTETIPAKRARLYQSDKKVNSVGTQTDIEPGNVPAAPALPEQSKVAKAYQAEVQKFSELNKLYPGGMDREYKEFSGLHIRDDGSKKATFARALDNKAIDSRALYKAGNLVLSNIIVPNNFREHAEYQSKLDASGIRVDEIKSHIDAGEQSFDDILLGMKKLKRANEPVPEQLKNDINQAALDIKIQRDKTELLRKQYQDQLVLAKKGDVTSHEALKDTLKQYVEAKIEFVSVYNKGLAVAKDKLGGWLKEREQFYTDKQRFHSDKAQRLFQYSNMISNMMGMAFSTFSAETTRSALQFAITQAQVQKKMKEADRDLNSDDVTNSAKAQEQVINIENILNEAVNNFLKSDQRINQAAIRNL
ncbi:hypothetical protein [Pantoea cypripedii]|uniref:Uncharacterized protein n=1 Tax=Pantoea cypripedii TaxID=55209 RepID=A0A6B9GG56_PANCY|nr:hypothetical protein [Pantoea cypripedii]QGY32186.1 hypothetical protein CUN67_24650 [Pantoea cypripedii]